MPLKKRVKQQPDAPEGKPLRRISKRQRVLDLFRRRKQAGEEQTSQISVPTQPATVPPNAPRDSKITDSPKRGRTDSTSEQNAEQTSPSPHSRRKQSQEHKEEQEQQRTSADGEDKAHSAPLTEHYIHALFSGAPQFFLDKSDSRPMPTVTFPWNDELNVTDVSDSMRLPQPAFSAATLRRHFPVLSQSSEQERQYRVYNVNAVELPNMLSSQGVEPGSIGFAHFLELPESDSLITDLQQSQSSNGFLEAVRNKEQMQKNPERLGIRRVHVSMIYDRLVEIGDLIEAFQESPRRMTLLNNQTSGDLYAHLFGKFLSPPRYDDNADDPTGMKVQIDTLLKVLRLKGVWYDFSLVEWRIRLGQLLWAEEDVIDDHSNTLWTPREILLLQITLGCELLLRLDAITSMDADEVKREMHVSREDFQGFLDLKTRKIEWDLVLAQRFLDNILVMKDTDQGSAKQSSPTKGLFSILNRGSQPEDGQDPDLVLVPRHQSRQLSGLLYFAENIHWPGLEVVATELATKLRVKDEVQNAEPTTSPYGRLLDPTTPSSISVYGTPLASPRSAKDGYFGHVARPAISRSNSRALTVPLATEPTTPHAKGNVQVPNIGGWLSRSYLTGFIMPGEAMSHLLMSTLLENDKSAIAALGDSANLYGGFIYAERSWWSKTSIVGRVLACIEGSTDCMGWISVSRRPASLADGWYVLSSTQLSFEPPHRITAEEDAVARDTAIIPGDNTRNINSEDLILPQDADTPPIPSVELQDWTLVPLTTEFSENEDASTVTPETGAHSASLVFNSIGRTNTHTLSLTHDVQFVSSFPCTPPSQSDPISPLQITKNPLPSSASTRSMHSVRSSSARLSRTQSHRSQHGYEPLLSHPPESPSIKPTRFHDALDADHDDARTSLSTQRPQLMLAHPLHISYKYRIVPAGDTLSANFTMPSKRQAYLFPAPSNLNTPVSENADQGEDTTILILDARSSRDLELLARAWCAENGFHALIGRVGRTCLACCVREARGLGIGIIIRV